MSRYPDNAVFRGSIYDTEPARTPQDAEADAIEDSLAAIENIIKNNRVLLANELKVVCAHSWAAEAELQNKAKTSTPIETLVDLALDCTESDVEEYIAEPLRVALERLS